jgi:nucleoside-diphosphate-sugar epimerase
MVKVFITGATGQLGFNLVKVILNEQKLGVSAPSDLLCLVRSPEKAFELKNLGVSIIKGDLLDEDAFNEILKYDDLTHFFHIAANCVPSAKWKDLYPPNVLGSRKLLEIFCKSPAKCFVFTSSISVYDVFLKRDKNFEITEDSAFGQVKKVKKDPYAVSKRMVELEIQDLKDQYPDKTFLIVRPGLIVGPGDRLILPAFVKAVSIKFLPKLIDGGKDTLSLSPPYDVARAMVFLSEYGHDISGEAYNTISENVSYKRVFSHISHYYDCAPPVVSVPLWLFKIFKPFLSLVKHFFPKNKNFQNFFSSTSLNFMGKSYIFRSDKIKKLGFKYSRSAEETINNGLLLLDPEKKLVKKIFPLSKKPPSNSSKTEE